MAKYVGKRVVPIHCGIWDQNKEYEMLSIVLDEENGNSYIARKVVPVGIMLTNSEYWILYSLFSQQVEITRAEFEERQEEIERDNAETLGQIRADNDATEQAIMEDNDATELAIRESNAATAQTISQNNANTLHQIQVDNDETETAIRQNNETTAQAIAQNNLDTLRQIQEDNDATVQAIREDNDATEQAIKEDNTATKEHVEEVTDAALSAMNQVKQAVDATKAALTARMDTIAGQATSDNEVLDARVDFRNNSHENLGQHLRTIERELKDEHEALFAYSRNLLDVSAMIPGHYVNQYTGRVENNAAHSVTELMEIESNTTFTYSSKFDLYGSLRVAFYDGEKNYISGVLSETTFTSPANAVYMRLSDMTGYLEDDAQLELGSERTDYVPYSRKIDSDLIQSYTKDEADALLLALRNRIIEPGNTTFFWASQNLFDKDAVTRGYFIHQGTGELQVNAAHVCSDFIEVDPNSDYTFSGDPGQALRYAFYDVDHDYITGAWNPDGITPYTVTSPAGAAYIRFSLYGTVFDRGGHQLEKGDEATAYTEYGSAHLISAFAPVKETFLLNLPTKLYALVGEELNIYFDNLVDGHDTDYVFDVESNVGMQLERCFRFEPTAAGSYPIAISATNRDGVTVRKNSTIYVAAAGAGSGVSRSLIVLGDSTTNNGIAITKLNNNFSGDAMHLETIGTRGTGINMHEGRSGWTFRNCFSVQIDSGAPDVFNPFYNPDTQTFDAAYYFANSGVAKPDWFFINLGINDVFSYSQDSVLAGIIDDLNSMCDAMILSIKEASPDTKIGVVLTIPPNYSQDAFGKAYKCAQNRARYKRNNVIWVNNQIERYENREEEGIYLVPVHTNLDTKYNMGMETNYHNKRNTSMTYESPIQNGGVHPVDSGYWQIADIYWFFLKNMEAQ